MDEVEEKKVLIPNNKAHKINKHKSNYVKGVDGQQQDEKKEMKADGRNIFFKDEEEDNDNDSVCKHLVTTTTRRTKSGTSWPGREQVGLVQYIISF